MDKKGLSYVDWAISLGIFLIFTLTIFVIFKPHVIESHSSEYLVSIAEQGIKENGYYEIDRYPLFVKSSVSVNGWLELSMDSYSDLFSNGVRVYDSDLTLIDYNTDYNTDSNNLQFGDINLGVDDVYEFGILRSELDLFADDGTVPGTPIIYCSDSEVECTFGIVEKLKGFSEQNIFDLFSCDDGDCCGDLNEYNHFKEIIRYPSARDLSVNISDGNVNYGCGFIEPQELDNVFAFNWADSMLQINGTKIPVNVGVRVW
jgi:hypothetical protein